VIRAGTHVTADLLPPRRAHHAVHTSDMVQAVIEAVETSERE